MEETVLIPPLKKSPRLSREDIHRAQASARLRIRVEKGVRRAKPSESGVPTRSWAWPLSSSDRKSECFSIPRHFGQFHAPFFVGTVWSWFLPLPTWLCSRAQSKVPEDLDESPDEPDWPAQSPDLDPIDHLWDELEQRLRARSPPSSARDRQMRLTGCNAVGPAPSVGECKQLAS